MDRHIDESQKKVNREFLHDHGMKMQLIDRLSDLQILSIMSFAMDHVHNPNLGRMLVQLASLDLTKHRSCSYLVSNQVATMEQLKSLSKEQISMISDDYRGDSDFDTAVKAVREAVIEAQQRQLAFYHDTDYDTRGHKPITLSDGANSRESRLLSRSRK